MVAMLSIVVIGMAAFTVDFGMAYASTRQLQTASDAAALAAASVYADYPGACPTLVADSAIRGLAQAAADDIRAQNRDGSTGGPISVTCNATGEPEVTYSSTGSTPPALTGVFGQSGDFTNTRAATAVVEVPRKVNARPYALCAGLLPATIPSTVFRMELPGTAGNSNCPGADTGGNWWSIDCPEGTSNSTSVLANQTTNGCTTPVSVVPNQGTRTGAALRTYLVASCPDRSSSCLSANPGNLTSNPIDTAWETLSQQQKKIVLPVFCGNPPCDQGAVSPDNGNGTIYPVQGHIGVMVCGYRWGNSKYGPTGGLFVECAGSTNNPSNYQPTDVASSNNYLLLKAIRLKVSGDTEDSDCILGAACDTGLRQLRLVR